MRYKLEIAHNGINKNMTIEPSQYQDKKVYQVSTDTGNFVLYFENDAWKQADSSNQDTEWIAKVGEAIQAIESMVSLPTF